MARCLRLLLSVLVTLSMMVGFGQVAHPVNAYVGQYPYDATDPSGTGCSNSSTYTPNGYTLYYDIWNGYNGYGALELRWSPTCYTVWAKFTCINANSECVQYHLQVYRVNPDGGQLNGDYTSGLPIGQHVYTLQLYDAGSFRTKVCIWSLYLPANEACTPLW